MEQIRADLRKVVIALDSVESEISGLTAKMDQQADINQTLHGLYEREHRRSQWLMISVVLDIVLSAAIIVGGYFIDHNQDEIAKLQEKQRASAQVTRDAQCALINLFLQSEANVKKNPTYSEEQKAQQVESFVVLHRLYDTTLKCQ